MSCSARPLRSRPVVGSLLTAGLLALGAVGCGGTEPTGTSQAPPAPTASAPTSAATPAASAPPTTAAASPSGEKRVQALPESVLKPVPGLTYNRIKGAPEITPEIAAKADFLEGIVTRALVKGSATAGTVQLLRTRPGVISDNATRAEFLQEAMSGFAQKKKFSETRINGLKVLSAKDVRGTGGTVAGWVDGRDLVVIFAVRGLSAEKLARSYLTGR